jgi:hypothetical protein
VLTSLCPLSVPKARLAASASAPCSTNQVTLCHPISVVLPSYNTRYKYNLTVCKNLIRYIKPLQLTSLGKCLLQVHDSMRLVQINVLAGINTNIALLQIIPTSKINTKEPSPLMSIYVKPPKPLREDDYEDVPSVKDLAMQRHYSKIQRSSPLPPRSPYI